MNRTEWLVGTDPSPMLKLIQGKQIRRKARLFSCACCRRLWSFLPPESREGVDAAERAADGQLSRPDLDVAHARSNAAVLALPRVWSYEVLRLRYATAAAAECSSRLAVTIPGAISIASTAAHAAAVDAAYTAQESEFAHTRDVYRGKELVAQARLVREIFGNPFAPVGFAPEWRTDTAVALARQMCEANEFSAMPILADALQDAGCDDATVLDHCRGIDQDEQGEPHVRGCWVADLVLDRATGVAEFHPQSREERL